MLVNSCFKPTFSGWYERDLGQLEGSFSHLGHSKLKIQAELLPSSHASGVVEED